MLDWVQSVDAQWFYWINGSHQNLVFDRFMPWFTGSGNWDLPILVVFSSLLIFGGRQQRTAALLVIPLLLLSDQTSSHFMKNFFERARPCNALENVHLLVGCSSSFSLPSSHAANFGAASIHFALYFPRWRIVLITFAVLMAYSRVYVGVHYPIDTAVGLLVGLLAALIVFRSYHFFGTYKLRRSRPLKPKGLVANPIRNFRG